MEGLGPNGIHLCTHSLKNLLRRQSFPGSTKPGRACVLMSRGEIFPVKLSLRYAEAVCEHLTTALELITNEHHFIRPAIP